MEVNFSKIQIIGTIVLLFVIFSLSNLFNINILKQAIGFLFLVFIPGFIISFFLYKKDNILERFVCSVALSLVILIVITLFFNLVLKLKIDDFFITVVFLVSISPILLLIRKKNFALKFRINRLDKLGYLFLFFVLLSIIVRIILFFDIHTILGADIGRFSIISHTYILKQEITTDLRPYDMVSGFFYFPGAFIVPMLLELIGFDPILGVTILSFFIDIVSLFAFYLLASRFFDRKTAITAFFFYSFLLDALLNMTVFGVFPHAFSVFFLFILMIASVDVFLFKKKDLVILSMVLIGIFSFHLYSIFIFICFIFSLFTYEITIKKKFSDSKNLILVLVKASAISLLLLLPYLAIFGKFYYLKFDPRNIGDLMTFSFGRNFTPFIQKIVVILFSAPVGPQGSVVSFLGFVVFLIAIRKLVKTQAIIFMIFMLYSTLFVLFVYDEYNLFRNVYGLWIVYAISFALMLDRPYLNLLILPLFFFAESQSPLYLLTYLVPNSNPQLPWIVSPDFNNVTDFIKSRIPLNSTFLIDGGGAGCTGVNPSYGERIFPSTSRGIFYFTDYCWADYNRTDYQIKVDIYRRISIDPNDSAAVNQVKTYNVTHVYIGPDTVGLNPQLFMKSQKYTLLYEKNENYIFQIN